MITTQVLCMCGKVEFVATGAPILVAACYCDDCQRASRQIETLPDAPPILSAGGGSTYVLYRKDRFECAKGSEQLQNLRLKDTSPTKRVIAGCCNSPMYLDFEKGHWVNVYCGRINGEAPPVRMRVQTRFQAKPDAGSDPIPSYRSFPAKFFAKLLLSRIAMVFS